MAKKKKKRVKRKREEKTKEERERDINQLRTKILSIGFPLQSPGIVELFKHFDEYVKDGVTWSGKIPLHGFQRECEVRLTTVKNFNNIVNLKYNENI